MGSPFRKPVQMATQAKIIKPVSPTKSEVSQSEATSADGYDSRKTKAKGRSATIITGSKGVTKKSGNYSLGKSSLLGQV
tara:strand:+ start:277 stop:513 length:237 start_codon:yes stop_codon:yes gene_type:complete